MQTVIDAYGQGLGFEWSKKDYLKSFMGVNIFYKNLY